MRLVSLLCLLPAAAVAQPGSIAGICVNAVNGQPLAGVHVRLFSGAIGSIKIYGAVSDKSGHFSITEMEPGTYILNADFPGFVYLPAKREESAFPGLPIKPGQKLEDYRLNMTPAAVIAGRVVDEYGDPVQNVPVSLSAISLAEERVNPFGTRNSSTNDRGEFRLVSVPGKFYLKAEPFPGSNEAPEIRTDGSADVTYGATFYPNAPSKDRAAQIEAIAGKEMAGLEIRLARIRSLTISGIVSGIPDNRQRPTLIMRFGPSERELQSSRSMGVDADGRFSFSRLAPGFYRFTAMYNFGQTRLQSAPVDVKLDSSDETNVELALTAGGDITGTLQLEGIPAGKRSVRMDSADMTMPVMNPDGKRLSGDVAENGSFQISGVLPGKYKVTVDPLPENSYLKSVQLDGALAPDGVLDLSSGARASRMSIVASGNGAQISGKVFDQNGQLVTNSFNVLVLLMDPTMTNQQATMRVTAEGTYSQKGIRPGKYRIFALDTLRLLDASAVRQANDFSQGFARSEEIELKAGDSIVKDIKMLEKEDGSGKK